MESLRTPEKGLVSRKHCGYVLWLQYKNPAVKQKEKP